MPFSNAKWCRNIIAHVMAYLPSYANAQIQYPWAEILLSKITDFSYKNIWILVRCKQNRFFCHFFRVFRGQKCKKGVFWQNSVPGTSFGAPFFQKSIFISTKANHRNSGWFSSIPKIYAKIFPYKLKRCQNWNVRVTAYFHSYKTSKIR